LIPYFSPETLKNYLNLVSVKWSELRAFMVQFRDEQQKDIEYFLDTPMLSKPFIQIDEGLVVLSKHILRASLSGLVPSLLKKDLGSAYKDKFGKAMENYIETLLTEVFPKVKTERQIKELYRKHQVSEKTKVVDFILEEDEGNVYIDSKAIEPDKTVKYSNTAVVIKQRLGNSFIKGVLQGLDCARTINKINGNKKSKRDSLIIITHMDHYISTGKTIEDMLDNSFFK
ncbi:TPA: orthopoxvirus A36R protein, partial [Escherichia coli]|nr:orthopoxvirus A36R protein [Escherichia coli]